MILGILKSYWILYYKNIIFQICVDNLHSSTSGVVTIFDLLGNSTHVHVHVHVQARSTKTRRNHMRTSELPFSFFKILSVFYNDRFKHNKLYATQIMFAFTSHHFRYLITTSDMRYEYWFPHLVLHGIGGYDYYKHQCESVNLIVILTCWMKNDVTTRLSNHTLTPFILWTYRCLYFTLILKCLSYFSLPFVHPFNFEYFYVII